MNVETNIFLILIEWLFKSLEWSSKYGLIDILFGIGIFSYFRRILQKKTVRSIPGVAILLEFLPDDRLEIEILNRSSHSLHIYVAAFRPGHQVDLSSFRPSKWRSWKEFMYLQWSTDGSPTPIPGKKTYVGGAIPLRPEDIKGISTSPLLEQTQSLFYRIPLVWPNLSKDTIRTNRHLGFLELFVVHGTTSLKLELQL